MARRADWVDYAKGIGIFLVVYAHLLSSGYHAHLDIDEYFFYFSDSLVYSFHMPLFFFLAGLFVGQSYLKRGIKSYLTQKIQALAYPCLIWSVIQLGVECFFGGQSYRGADITRLLAIPYLPWAQFWFVYALLAMYVAYGVLRLLPGYSVFLLVISLMLFIWPIPSEILALHGFSTGFLFFVFGVLAREHLEIDGGYVLPFGVTLGLFCILSGSGWYVFERIITPTRLPDGSHPVFFFFLSGIGITACIGLAQWLAEKKWCSFLKTFGRYSLQIYLVHMLAGVAARIILLQVFHMSNPFLHMIVGVSAGLIVPIIFYNAALKIRFPYLFEWCWPWQKIEGR